MRQFWGSCALIVFVLFVLGCGDTPEASTETGGESSVTAPEGGESTGEIGGESVTNRIKNVRSTKV